jgi:uncharacterized RDD family membrane protein YckC
LSKSASLPQDSFDPFDSHSNESASGTAAWKQEVNQRLAAHRTRRGGPQETAGSMGGRDAESPRAASNRAAEAAARVAARYAKAPSYSELLAGEARAVVRAAGAAAEAARNAQAAAQAVLAGLESGPIASGQWEPVARNSGPALDEEAFAQPETPPSEVHVAPARWQDEPPSVAANPTGQESTGRESARAGAQPRWEVALPVTAPAPPAGRDVWSEMRIHPRHESGHEGVEDHHQRYRNRADEGDSELFPLDPFDLVDLVASATVEPVQHLPANLIEFPRELVATRKARPRLAEGPFYDASRESPQLNIFEVDPALLAPPVYLSDTPSGTVAPPEWASIELDELDHRHAMEFAAPGLSAPEYSESQRSGSGYVEQHYSKRAYEGHPYAAASEMLGGAVNAMPVQGTPAQSADVRPKAAWESASSRTEASTQTAELVVAPISDRVLASVVDGALVSLAFLAAAVVVIASTAHPPTGRIALIASGCGLLLFGLLYQFLFLSYAEEGTPGMRYARIALCTFDDDNPSSQQMIMRIPALLLAALPAGLGLLWAVFDGDHLGWHDRMTRTYQRKY